MLNICLMENKIPTIWRQSKIIAILKPGTDSSIPKKYRPISLLCHMYKLYERMILNRIAHVIEQHLMKEQASFRSGKYCTSQLLNLTQHIENEYEEDMITGTAFVDLSAAYDTVNRRLLIQKLYNTTLDSQLCRVIQNLLSDRRFCEKLNNERSKWRIQKNGCCSPSETYGRKWGNSNFQILTELPVPPQALNKRTVYHRGVFRPPPYSIYTRTISKS